MPKCEIEKRRRRCGAWQLGCIRATPAAAPPASSSSEPQLTYLAIDLSVTRLAAGVVDDAGKLIVRDRVATPSRHVWPALARLVGRVIAAAPEGARPARCGVACPGPIDRVGGGAAAALLAGGER